MRVKCLAQVHSTCDMIFAVFDPGTFHAPSEHCATVPLSLLHIVHDMKNREFGKLFRSKYQEMLVFGGKCDFLYLKHAGSEIWQESILAKIFINKIGRI